MTDTTRTASDARARYELVFERLHHLAPIGYKLDHGNWQFVIDEAMAPLVKRAWELAHAGIVVDDILLTLNNELGFRTPIRGRLGGKRLHRSALYRILHDPFYAGYVHVGDEIAKGFHEPLVSTEMFWEVQKILNARRHHPSQA